LPSPSQAARKVVEQPKPSPKIIKKEIAKTVPEIDSAETEKVEEKI
jgi:hypothetical protein